MSGPAGVLWLCIKLVLVQQEKNIMLLKKLIKALTGERGDLDSSSYFRRSEDPLQTPQWLELAYRFTFL